MLYIEGEKNTPQEMRQLRQWVNWRYEMRQGKQTKVPHNPHTLKHASSTASHTWGTYEDAVARVSAKTGLGFVLTPPYIGIDLDHCVANDGTLSLVAQEILARFPTTYQEWSPSGTGVHLFLRGTLVKALHTKLGEIYTAGRYFTVTGQALPRACPTVLAVSDADIAWLIEKLTPTRQKDRVKKQLIDVMDITLVDTALFAALCQNDLSFLPIWRKEKALEGTDEDQSDSAYEMSIARRAVLCGVDDQDIYKLLVQWRDMHHIVAKHHKALVLTIENAHKEHVETEMEKALEIPETFTSPDQLTMIRKLLHLPIVRLVQMGRGDAQYRVHLRDGTVLDLGNYTKFKAVDRWEKLVWEYAGKHLHTEKKRWAKICRLLLSFCEVEESEETSQAAETQAWLAGYLSDTTSGSADVTLLARSNPFVDDTGRYLALDDFVRHAGVHCGAKIPRNAMQNRLKVLGWCVISLTRADEKRTLTRNYWYKPN